MGEDKDAVIAGLRTRIADLEGEIREGDEIYARASQALTDAGVPHLVPGRGTDELERLAERVRYLANRAPWVTVGVDLAAPGSERTIRIVRICGCGATPACPEGPSCPRGFYIGRPMSAADVAALAG
jgi:hypothetical protein